MWFSRLLIIGVFCSGTASATFSFFRTVTIDHTKIGSADLTNYPLAFFGTFTYLKTVGNGGNVQSANGYDIVFKDSTGVTTLDFERVSWIATTGVVEFHVRVPSVSHTVDTVVNLYYGDASIVTDQSNKTGTWNSSYKGVYHVGENPITAVDSSASPNNPTAIIGETVYFASGKVAGAMQVCKAAPISCVSAGGGGPSYSDSKMVTGANVRTVETWFQSNGGNSAVSVWSYGTNAAGQLLGFVWVNSTAIKMAGGTGHDITWSVTVSTNTWYHAVWTYDGTQEHLYINGVQIGTGQAVALTTTGNGTLKIGQDNWDTGFWTGYIDETRFSNVVQSDSYILACYNNQNAPSTFYTISAAIPIVASAGLTRTMLGIGQ